jgi:hypothetical protein
VSIFIILRIVTIWDVYWISDLGLLLSCSPFTQILSLLLAVCKPGCRGLYWSMRGIMLSTYVVFALALRNVLPLPLLPSTVILNIRPYYFAGLCLLLCKLCNIVCEFGVVRLVPLNCERRVLCVDNEPLSIMLFLTSLRLHCQHGQRRQHASQ